MKNTQPEPENTSIVQVENTSVALPEIEHAEQGNSDEGFEIDGPNTSPEIV